MGGEGHIHTGKKTKMSTGKQITISMQSQIRLSYQQPLDKVAIYSKNSSVNRAHLILYLYTSRCSDNTEARKSGATPNAVRLS